MLEMLEFYMFNIGNLPVFFRKICYFKKILDCIEMDKLSVILNDLSDEMLT